MLIQQANNNKAAKHKAVRVLATAKLNTVHSHISKAVEDCRVSADEYKLILDEVEKYRTMEEIRHKYTHTAGDMVDDETKNGMIRRGREQARACFTETIKKLASSESSSL